MFLFYEYNQLEFERNLFQDGKIERDFLIIPYLKGKHEGAYGDIMLVLNKYDKLLYIIKKVKNEYCS